MYFSISKSQSILEGNPTCHINHEYKCWTSLNANTNVNANFENNHPAKLFISMMQAVKLITCACLKIKYIILSKTHQVLNSLFGVPTTILEWKRVLFFACVWCSSPIFVAIFVEHLCDGPAMQIAPKTLLATQKTFLESVFTFVSSSSCGLNNWISDMLQKCSNW